MENKYNVKRDLSLLIEEGNYYLEDVAFETDVSIRTLRSVLNGENVSDFVIESIYDFIYRHGYRLNLIKESVYKEKSKHSVLFHGSKYGLDNITIDGSRKTCDFGSGFYLGENYNQAVSFVAEFNKSCVYAFELDMFDLNVVELDLDINWMLLICCHRGTLKKYAEHPIMIKALDIIKNADVIIAPIADNKMFYIMQLFANGEITTMQAIHSLAASSLGKQFVLKTDKAISKLKMLERLYVPNIEKNKYLEDLSDRAYLIDTKLKMSKREFKNEGQYIEELFS